MQLTLIDGSFSAAEAKELLTRLVQVKLRFHEERIATGSTEEDVSMREKRISRLQHELSVLRTQLDPDAGAVELQAVVEIRQ